MPIEFYFIRPADGRNFDHTLLEHDDLGELFSDYLSDVRQVIAIECSEEDEGGRVLVYPSEGLIAEGQSSEESMFEHDELPDPIEVEEVGMDEPYRRLVANQVGKLAILVVRYRKPFEITPSGLIPKGLSSPN
jgi:hypothetical protein